jgi:putative methionine-R-sulfoxide reductase with GAF domain
MGIGDPLNDGALHRDVLNTGVLNDVLNADVLNKDRRRQIRQKLHTPVYVSFDGPDSGVAVDLSELLDLHEEGFAVQTGERLEVNRTVTLCLDLPETKSYIHGSGQVIWSDEAGRGGIRFSALSESSRQVLRQWLFSNLLIATNNDASRFEQPGHLEDAHHEDARHEEKLLVPASVDEPEPEISTRPSPVITMLRRAETVATIETVRCQIRELNGDVDAVLRLITERAQNLTGASGAALAFLTRIPTRPSNRMSNHDQMICRARSGEPAPPLGAVVETQHGLSGECVRTGLTVSCEDMANPKDPRVDPEVGRALGIGSLIAVPIVSDFRVVGLLEVFSPSPYAFANTQATILERLVELIPSAYQTTADYETTELESPPPEGRVPVRATPRSPVRAAPLAESDVAESDIADRTETPNAPPRMVYRALLGLVTVVVATVLGYVVGPIVGRHWLTSRQAAQQNSAEVVEASTTGQRPRATSLADLQRLANQGDADAQWQMGIRCHASYPPDDAQAMQWFERAAGQGYVAAQATLGAYYWAGRGVPSDLSKAYMWSAIALAGGDQNSKIRLEGLASQMTRAQISAARQQAEEWMHQHNAKSEAN